MAFPVESRLYIIEHLWIDLENTVHDRQSIRQRLNRYSRVMDRRRTDIIYFISPSFTWYTLYTTCLTVDDEERAALVLHSV